MPVGHTSRPDSMGFGCGQVRSKSMGPSPSRADIAVLLFMPSRRDHEFASVDNLNFFEIKTISSEVVRNFRFLAVERPHHVENPGLTLRPLGLELRIETTGEERSMA